MIGGGAWLAVQLGLATCLLMVGATIAAAGGLLSGLLLVVVGLVWAGAAYRRL